MEKDPQLGDSSALHHELPSQVPYAGTLSERLLFSIEGGVEARLAKRDRETARHGASNDAGFPDIMCVTHASSSRRSTTTSPCPEKCETHLFGSGTTRSWVSATSAITKSVRTDAHEC